MLFKPGHNVHYIQARKGAQASGRVGELLSVSDEGHVQVEFPQGSRDYRLHDPERLRADVPIGSQVEVRERWSLLAVPSDQGRRMFSVCVPSEWEPCVTEGPEASGDLAARLKHHGGFIVPGRVSLEGQRDAPSTASEGGD